MRIWDLSPKYAAIVALLHGVGFGVPRESPHFDPELHVADISESEVVPREDRREAEKGCHWTARLQMELCGGDRCEQAEILAFDFQRRAWAFYENASIIGPPLEEAVWISTMPDNELMSAFDLCPGLVVTALLLAAEVKFPVAAFDEAQRHLQQAKALMTFLFRSDAMEYGALAAAWPVELARDRTDALRVHAMQPQSRLASVDVVIARCGTSLHWLWTVPLPPQARVLVYAKCERPEGELERQLAGVRGRVAEVLSVPAYDSGPWMTGECGAYLRHMLAALAGEKPVNYLADYIVFIHDDAPRHLKPAFLGLAMRALAVGAYEAPFLNLAHERYVQARTPCLERLYELTFGRSLHGRLSTYCCGHFVASAGRIRSAASESLRRLLHIVENGELAALAGGPCEVAHMPCYVVEYVWHVLLGEADIATWRSEDVRLPLFLRYEGGRATRLPSPLGVEPYMQMQPHYAQV